MADFPHGNVLLSCIGNLEHRRPFPAFHATVVFDAIVPSFGQNFGDALFLCSALWRPRMLSEDVFEGTYEMVVQVQWLLTLHVLSTDALFLSLFRFKPIYTLPVLYDLIPTLPL